MILAGMPYLLGANGCGGGVALAFGINERTEIDIGQDAAREIEAEYGVVNDPVQTPRIQQIGYAIASRSPRANLPWSFKILNLQEINAVSLPGGPIYVTRGLLATGLSDNELAAVLAHEIAHVTERHAVKAIQSAMTYQLIADLVLGGSSEALRMAADLAAEYALLLPRSRSDEYEADAVGIRLAYNAGYPANGMVIFLQRLMTATGPDRTPAWARTHPLTQDRITRADQVVAEVAGQPRPVPVALSEENLKILKSLNDAEQKTPATVPTAKPVTE